MEQFSNLIDGKWVESASEERFVRRNPANEDLPIGSFPNMDTVDVNFAVEAAEKAFESWREIGILFRGQILLRSATLIRERSEHIALDLSREMGKTLNEARAEVASAANFFEYNGGLARHPVGELLSDKRFGVRGWSQREPIGVVCLITPWNDPSATPARKLGPALLCGNTVVLKPAPETPLAARHLIEVLHDAGAPPGVVNLVTGENDRVGPAILANRQIAGISFTGSTTVGRYLERELAGTGTRVQAEMGGKNAVLVMSDSNLTSAVEAIISAGFGQTGQRCTATSRVLVERGVAEELQSQLLARVQELTIGAGEDPGTHVGPLVSPRQLENVTKAIKRAAAEGGRVVCGGMRPTTPSLLKGNFFKPTLIADVSSNHSVWREEIFGPVVALMTVDSLDEGIQIVNDSPYGLSASIFTSSLSSANRFVEQVNTGQVAVNLPTIGWDVHVPFGGFKDSGSPFKEHGLDGLRFYSRIKSVMIDPT